MPSTLESRVHQFPSTDILSELPGKYLYNFEKGEFEGPFKHSKPKSGAGPSRTEGFSTERNGDVAPIEARQSGLAGLCVCGLLARHGVTSCRVTT